MPLVNRLLNEGPYELLIPEKMKAICIKHLQDYVSSFQERRGKVTDAIVDEFMKPRPLQWKGNPRVPRTDLAVPVAAAEGKGKDDAVAGDEGGAMTKNALKKQAKAEKIAREKAEKAAAKAAKATEAS